VLATDIDEMDCMEPMIGEMIKDAECIEAVAFSLILNTKKYWEIIDIKFRVMCIG